MHLSGVERDGAARLAIFDGEHGGGGLDDHRRSAIPGELQIGVLPFGMQAYGRLRRGLGRDAEGRSRYRLRRGRLRPLKEEARLPEQRHLPRKRPGGPTAAPFQSARRGLAGTGENCGRTSKERRWAASTRRRSAAANRFASKGNSRNMTSPFSRSPSQKKKVALGVPVPACTTSMMFEGSWK